MFVPGKLERELHHEVKPSITELSAFQGQNGARYLQIFLSGLKDPRLLHVGLESGMGP